MITPMTPAMITSRTIHRKSAMTIAESSDVRTMRRNSGSVRSARRLLCRRSTRRRSFADSRSPLPVPSAMQRLLQVGDEVVDILDADAEPHEAVGNPGLGPFLGAEMR